MSRPRTDTPSTLELLKQARCPNTNCVDGAIPWYSRHGELDMQQCQWCFERNLLLNTPASESGAGEIKANPERLSSLEHSEVKPDGAAEIRSGAVDPEGRSGDGIARCAALVAGGVECRPRSSGSEADRAVEVGQNAAPQGAASSAARSTPASAIEAIEALREIEARYQGNPTDGCAMAILAKDWLNKLAPADRGAKNG